MGEQKSNQTEQDLNHVLKARRDKLAELQAAGKDPFQITKYDVTAHSMEIKDHYDQWEEKEVSIAGRMMFKRVMGKASFCNLQDLQGRIQVYVARDSVGEDAYKEFKKLDIGDIVGVKEQSLLQRQEKFPYTQVSLPFFPRAFRFFLRSSTALQIQICATARDMWI